MRTRLMVAVAVFGALAAVAIWPNAGASAAPVPPATTPTNPVAVKPEPKPEPVPVAVVANPDPPAKPPLVQLAILLDTSGSMSGLIDQARTQLWGIVNALASAQRGGLKPRVQLALYAYGEAGFPNEIHRRTSFTEDLDLVSRELFALNTTGGFEPVGTVIRDATKQLEWSDDPDTLKIIYVAGNEEVTQGEVNPYTAAKAALKKGIVVNLVNCGDSGEIVSGWRQTAVAGGGAFFGIDQNQRVVDVATPHDAELARLNLELNKTYVPYGAQGGAAYANQAAQDSNAASVSTSTLAARAASKSSGLYRASNWDLVDATKDGTVKLEDAKEDELPAELKGKNTAERTAWVEAKRQERVALQTRIATLAGERQKFVEAERAKAGGPQSLDSAIIGSLKTLGAKSRLTFR